MKRTAAPFALAFAFVLALSGCQPPPNLRPPHSVAVAEYSTGSVTIETRGGNEKRSAAAARVEARKACRLEDRVPKALSVRAWGSNYLFITRHHLFACVVAD